MLPGFVSAVSCSREHGISWFMFPGNMVWTTWPSAFMWIFWSERSIRQINAYSVLLYHGWVTNLLHLFRDITKQILTVSLDQHWKIIPFSCAMLPSGISFHCCPMHQTIIVYCWSRLTVNICLLYHEITKPNEFLPFYHQTSHSMQQHRICVRPLNTALRPKNQCKCIVRCSSHHVPH